MEPIHYGKQSINNSDIEAVSDTLTSPLITTGPKAAQFEKAICKISGANYCVAVSSGTAALHLASLVLLKKGDLVLTTPNSFLATSNSVLYAGAKPIFVDICEDGSIDLELCEKELKKNSNIKAIYAVSFSGKLLNQEKLQQLKETYDIKILEDNAHSIGAIYKNTKAGSCENSDISIFSFHPVKTITTGEGGAITTSSKELYKKLLSLRNHGIVKTPDMKPWEYEMRNLGFNYRITDFQCALGLNQLKRLGLFLKRRREIAKIYHEAFKNSNIKPLYPYNTNSAYHLFVVKIKNSIISKEEIFQKLSKKNIRVQLHYMPINRQPYYKKLGYGDEKTPMMDRYFKEAFSLPIYPNLTIREQEYVIENLLEILR
ncbi:MAG: UDP-4-amino-4,6-dideoxy-N-acetyl-beta-L-altrosamine transaminase [Sulfurospirillum sp.]